MYFFIYFEHFQHVNVVFLLPILNLFSYQLETWITRSQLTFTCSKSAIEILEKGVKYVQS